MGLARIYLADIQFRLHLNGPGADTSAPYACVPSITPARDGQITPFVVPVPFCIDIGESSFTTIWPPLGRHASYFAVWCARTAPAAAPPGAPMIVPLVLDRPPRMCP